MTDWIELLATPISLTTVDPFVGAEEAGGICVFAGTTRAERNAARKELAALDYEAYPEMAIRQLRDLADRAKKQWPIQKLAILHRTGRVAVGEASVVIAVATPHRGQAFEACRYLIDELKRDVAIWKKEVWTDGEMSWVQPK
jgi:molybdopterin synthase catalytic subunit